MVYLKEKKDAADAEIRNKKLEIADLLSALVSEHVEGSVSFFAGNYDEKALHEAARGMIELLVGPTPTEEQIPEIGKRLIESFRNLGQLLPSKTWELLSSRFTGIDTRIADLSENEFERWNRQMYNYVRELEFIRNFGKERLRETIERWEESWEGARAFLSKDGIERFFGTFSQVKELLFQIRRLRNFRNAQTFSSVLPLWPLAVLGLLLSFISAVLAPRQLFLECKNPECRRECFSGMTVASTQRKYSGHNFDNNEHGCPHCGEPAVYSWKDYHFR